MQNTKAKQKSYLYNPEKELKTRLLSEQEASSIAGVSLETISRYQEFGLLKPVFKNEIPFYRENELKSLFMLGGSLNSIEEAEGLRESDSIRYEEEVPTLSGLLSENLSPIKDQVSSRSVESKEDVIDHEQSQDKVSEPAPVPAVRLEDLIFENRNLKDKLTSLEDERDWLRRRVEQLEERSGREQMLLLSEKETLRDVLNATVVNSKRIESTHSASAQDYEDGSFITKDKESSVKPEDIKKPEQVTLRFLAKKFKNFLS